MTKLLYARMGRDNLRRNYRLYLPYLLACGGTVAMYYILSALAFGDVIGQEGLSFGTQYLKVMMEMGLYVVGLFACVFLFYTHAFLTKGRQQEFGLYNILGMEKRHIGRMMLYETLYAYLISLAGGVAGGALLSKLLALFALRLMRMEGDAALTIQWQAVASTAALFGGIFALTWLRDLLAIHLSSPAQLLRGGQAGEKEPRARWLLALLGLAFLGSGYALALLCSQPVTALLMFFPAAALVVLGTYCLFTWGSVALVKLLRKNKAYYYQPNHFICVSGMMYRMKQNGVGLANICILCTMVLVMLSSTVSLYAGVEDSVARALPRQVNLWVEVEQDLSGLEAARDQALEEADLTMTRPLSYHCLSLETLAQGERFQAAPGAMEQSSYVLSFLPLEEVAGQLEDAALEPGQALIQVCQGQYAGERLEVLGHVFQIVGQAALDFDPGASGHASGGGRITLVVADRETLRNLQAAHRQAAGKAAASIFTLCAFDLVAEDEAQLPLAQRLSELAEGSQVSTAYQTCRDAYELYGSLFFVGLLLGTLFVMGAVLIMYYKQLSEGYQDRRRFQIMRNVGLELEQIRQAIRSQVLIVFFLPLMAAAMHIAFALPMIMRMFSVLSLTNAGVFLTTTAACLALFALFYALVYALTARAYYRIVSG